MVLHPGKTKSMVLASRRRHRLKPLMLNLTLDTNIMEQVREHRVLRVTTDEELKWQPHIDNVCKQLEINFCWASLGSMLTKLKKLEILPLQEQFVYNTVVFMFKAYTVWLPQRECDLLNRAPARYE